MLIAGTSATASTSSLDFVSILYPLTFGLLGATAIGYVTTLLNVIRRARDGQLHRADIRLPGFQLRWDRETRSYSVKSIIGSFNIEVSQSPGEDGLSAAAGQPKTIGELADLARAAAQEIDTALTTMQETLAARHSAIADLESKLSQLRDDEDRLQSRVDALREVEPEAATAFLALLDQDLDQREQRGTRRDLWIFLAGCVVTVIVSAAFFALS